MTFTNYLTTTQTIQFKWPAQINVDLLAESRAAGGTGSYSARGFGFNGTDNTNVTVPANGSVTISQPYGFTTNLSRGPNGSSTDIVGLFVVGTASTFGPYTKDLTFGSTYTQGGVTKTYSIPFTLVYSGAAAEVAPSSWDLAFNFGGPPSTGSEAGKAKIALNARGKMAAGYKVELTIKADAARALPAQKITMGTTLAGTADSDLQQYINTQDNPTGALNDRDVVITIKSADGVTVSTTTGHTPVWDGTMKPGDPPTPDYAFVYQMSANVAGRFPDSNPSADPANPKPTDKTTAADSISGQLDVDSQRADADKGLGKGFGDGVGSTGFNAPGQGGASTTGKSSTYVLGPKATLNLSSAEPWLSYARGAILGILYFVIAIQAVKTIRGASAA